MNNTNQIITFQKYRELGTFQKLPASLGQRWVLATPCPLLSWHNPLSIFINFSTCTGEFFSLEHIALDIPFYWEPSHYKMYQMPLQKSSGLASPTMSPSAGDWIQPAGCLISTHSQLPSPLMPLPSSTLGKLSKGPFPTSSHLCCPARPQDPVLAYEI